MKKRSSRIALAAALAFSPIVAEAQNFSGGGPTPSPGAFPPTAPIVGCVYLPPTFTLPPSLLGVALTCDATGALRVTIASGGAGGGVAYGPDATSNTPSKPPILDGHLDANGKVQPNAPGTPDPVNDAQNAPYGLGGTTAPGALTPGNTSNATPGRDIHIFCAPTTSPATGYTSLTLANGDVEQVQLASGAQYDFPWAVVQVAAQTTVTGTLAPCSYRNMN